MYEIMTPLTSESIEILTALQHSVSMDSRNIRLGKNGYDKLSDYEESKWTSWTRQEKSTYKAVMGNLIDKSLIGWFLRFPENSGFLDEMDYWVNRPSAGLVVAYALKDNQKICIAGEEITVNKGEGIRFSLKEIHEVKSGQSEQIWACLMQLL
jgi:hypothetical protein